jgi:hypothetical protein
MSTLKQLSESLERVNLLKDNWWLLNQYLVKENSLASETIASGELPSRRRIAKAIVTGAKELANNPAGFVQKGIERDKAFNTLAKVAGSNRMAITGNVMNALKEPLLDIGMMGGGAIGYGLGALSGGGATGSLAGDFIGGLVTRRAVDDTIALGKAIVKARQDQKFGALPPLKKAQYIQQNTYDNIVNAYSKKRLPINDDITGWSLANMAESLPLPNFPMKGALVATAYSRPFNKGYEALMEGNTLETAMSKVKQDFKDRTFEIFGNGDDRERLARQKINSAMQSTFPVVSAVLSTLRRFQ